jgi:hypothetical protein
MGLCLFNRMFSIRIICPARRRPMVSIKCNRNLNERAPVESHRRLLFVFSNYYASPIGIRYPPSGLHPYPQYVAGPPVHHHHPHHHPAAPPPPPPPHPTAHHPHAHHHPIIGPPHVPTNPVNGYNVSPFLPHAANTPFASTSTSTFITHHQTATQPISTALTTALSEDEFYIKQRYFQRM